MVEKECDCSLSQFVDKYSVAALKVLFDEACAKVLNKSEQKIQDNVPKKKAIEENILKQKSECLICQDEIDKELPLVHGSGSSMCKGFTSMHPSCLFAYITNKVTNFSCFKEFQEKTIDPECPICHKETLLSKDNKNLLIAKLAKQYHKIPTNKLAEWWGEQMGVDKETWEKEFSTLPKPAKKNKRSFSALDPVEEPTEMVKKKK